MTIPPKAVGLATVLLAFPALAAITIKTEQHAPAFKVMTCGDDPCVWQGTYQLCATDKYSDGKERETCKWDAPGAYPWVYATKALCDSEMKRELSVTFGDWRTISHERLRAVAYRCTGTFIISKPNPYP